MLIKRFFKLGFFVIFVPIKMYFISLQCRFCIKNFVFFLPLLYLKKNKEVLTSQFFLLADKQKLKFNHDDDVRFS